MIPFGLWTLFSLVLIVKTRKLVINDTDNILSDSVLKEIERAENEIALKEKENTSPGPFVRTFTSTGPTTGACTFSGDSFGVNGTKSKVKP